MKSWVVFLGGEVALPWTWRSLTSVVGPICPKLALPRKGIDYEGPVTEPKFSRPRLFRYRPSLSPFFFRHGAANWFKAPFSIVSASLELDRLPPEATGAIMEVTKWLKPSDSVSRIGDSASVQALARQNSSFTG